MSRRCRAGQRARIIDDGPDKGTIVLVVRPYFYPEVVDNANWPRTLRAWVVTSLGAPLNSVNLVTGEDNMPARTSVRDDLDLEPIDDDDGVDDSQFTDLPKPETASGSKEVA